MELKTKITAEDGRQELTIERTFDLPVDLLFMAYTEPEIVEQWMNTKVLVLENRDHGSWSFETTDPKGGKHLFHGTIHSFIPGKAITRTFEMAGAGVGIQLEFLEFFPLSDTTSRLQMHIVYRSVAHRDEMLQRGMTKGMSMAHDRLQTAALQYKNQSS